MAKGLVYLVGGGPGDPELITLKGLNCLKKSDVIIYDALVNPKLLSHCQPSSEKIFVGKRRHRHTYEQDEINALMAQYADQGKIVCRLKGGDSFLFGRGGEEAEFLSKHGIAFEVVPGISSVFAVPAAAGIPLTHRNYASVVTIATGHASDGKLIAESKCADDLDWCRYGTQKTLVILMGFARIESIVNKLESAGWKAESPIALISSGTLPNQFVVTGALSNIVQKVRKFKQMLSSPALIVVGDVVKLRKKISTSGLEIDLINIRRLKAHEETIPERVKKIKDDIHTRGELMTPLWIEDSNDVVLNGHHRLAALKALGCELAPCVLFDYSSPKVEVQVCPGSSIKSINKKLILSAALTGNLFPPRSSLHVLKFDPPVFLTPLALLKKETREPANIF